MAKNQRQPVKITEQHLAEYSGLRKKGLSYRKCIDVVQEKFNMPVAHTTQAIYLRLKELEKPGHKPVLKPKGNGNGDKLGSLRLDQLQEIGFQIYEKALNEHAAKQENWRLKNRIATVENDNKILQEKVKKLEGDQQRLKLIQSRRGESVYGEE